MQFKVVREKLLHGAVLQANGWDKYFLCGMSLSNPSVLGKSKWEGENAFGRVLTSLQETFKH